MHAVDAGARVSHERLALAGADSVGEEIQVAAHVVDVRDQRTRHPEVDWQPRLARRLGEPENVVDQIEVETGTRLRAQHHPHDIAAFFVIGRDLRQIAGFEERAAVVMVL